MNLLEINIESLYELLGTDPSSGLSFEKVKKNRNEFGKNNIIKNERDSHSLARVFLGDVMVLLFIILSIVAVVFEASSSAVYCIILVAIIYLGFQVWAYIYIEKAGKIIDKSKSSKCKVIRDGTVYYVDSSQIVPGDIMLISKGDILLCDALVISQSTLRALEIMITGTSKPVIKLSQDDVLNGNGCPYYECILFAGTVITEGSAKVLVCNTGKNIFDNTNKLIFKAIQGNMPKIHKKAEFYNKQISLISIIICFSIFVFGLARGADVLNVFYIASTLAVSALPDIIITLCELSLYHGAYKLIKENCIVKNLSAVDKLCDVNCVIVDNSKYFRYKTPRPSEIYINDERIKYEGISNKAVKYLFEYSVLASDPENSDMIYNGRNVDLSLCEMGAELGINDESFEDRYFVIQKQVYDRNMGTSSALVFSEESYLAISKGYPDKLIRRCSYILMNGKAIKINERDKRRYIDIAGIMANQNQAVVAVAVKKIDYDGPVSDLNRMNDMVFVGFIGLRSFIKSEAAKAVNICKKSGIDVLLMTDEPYTTAIGLSKSLSILGEDDKIMTSSELYRADNALFRAEIKNYKVFLNLTEEQKRYVIDCRKKSGDAVAVTTDGLEDTLAQLEADISFITEGQSEEAVVQNSDIILEKGGFEYIPKCIHFGKCAYHNINHTFKYVIAFQFMLVFTAFFSLLFADKFIFSSAVLISFGIFICLPTAFCIATNFSNEKSLKNAVKHESKNLNIKSIMPLTVLHGFVGAVFTILSYRISMYISANHGTASCAALITFYISGFMVSFLFDEGILPSAKLIQSKLTGVCLPICIAVIILFCVVPHMNALAQITPPNSFTVILSVVFGILPFLLTTAIKSLKKLFIDNTIK